MAEDTPINDTVTEPVVDTVNPPATDVATPGDQPPHPLEPGGRRFEEVYARMKQAEQRAQEQAERVARLEGQTQAMQRPVQQPQYYTVDQLQAAVDRGQITPAVMAQQIAWQQTQIATAQYAQRAAIETKQKEAWAEVNQYMQAIPDLNKRDSAEITKVAAHAAEIGRDLGIADWSNDPVVQKLALRATYGSMADVTRRSKTREADRQSRVPHAETTTNGTEPERSSAQVDTAWRKGISQKQLDYWENHLKMTEKQMKEEAKYYKNREARSR